MTNNHDNCLRGKEVWVVCVIMILVGSVVGYLYAYDKSSDYRIVNKYEEGKLSVRIYSCKSGETIFEKTISSNGASYPASKESVVEYIRSLDFSK